MKTYVSHLNQTYVPHNKAEEAALKVAEQFNRKVVPEEDLRNFKAEFTNAIEHVNRQFPRCKDLVLDISDLDRNKEFRFSLLDSKSGSTGGLFVFYLYWGE